MPARSLFCSSLGLCARPRSACPVGGRALACWRWPKAVWQCILCSLNLAVHLPVPHLHADQPHTDWWPRWSGRARAYLWAVQDAWTLWPVAWHIYRATGLPVLLCPPRGRGAGFASNLGCSQAGDKQGRRAAAQPCESAPGRHPAIEEPASVPHLLFKDPLPLFPVRIRSLRIPLRILTRHLHHPPDTVTWCDVGG
jgi:hypothetical protein